MGVRVCVGGWLKIHTPSLCSSLCVNPRVDSSSSAFPPSSFPPSLPPLSHLGPVPMINRVFPPTVRACIGLLQLGFFFVPGPNGGKGDSAEAEAKEEEEDGGGGEEEEDAGL